MKAVAWIETKRDGGALTEADWRAFVQGVVDGSIPDYQISALLMAIYFRGMDAGETAALTLAIRDSGRTFQWPADPRPVVDKHSTGGVGDKVSLPLAPLLAALGFRVPMISGRSLGITGGTLDKLESIPGYCTRLGPERFVEQVQTVGCAIVGQTEDLVPADRKLYALRDVTGTVPSLPLITSSILSKKLAEGLDALVLDVKCGRAAFMDTPEKAHALARAMVELAHACGVRTCALITGMDVPLGRAVGNWLEVRESHRFLESCARAAGGKMPAEDGWSDLKTLVVECAARLLVLTGRARDPGRAVEQAEACLGSRAPWERWKAMLLAQGTRWDAYEAQLQADSLAPVVAEVLADREGWIVDCDARQIGELVRDLGGGRRTAEDSVDPAVGVDELARCGQWVRKGDLLGRVHLRQESQKAEAVRRLRAAFRLADAAAPPPPLVRDCLWPEPASARA
ncbi:MAG: thymidine phosphorylase [Limisphaera sp.]